MCLVDFELLKQTQLSYFVLCYMLILVSPKFDAAFDQLVKWGIALREYIVFIIIVFSFLIIVFEVYKDNLQINNEQADLITEAVLVSA